MLDRYDGSTLAIDAVLLFAVLPGTLAVLHVLLPASIHGALLFDHSQLDPVTMWTSAFVHLDDAHLYRNLTGYYAGVLPAWLLFLVRDRRRQFWWTMAAFLTVLPVIVSGTGYLFYRFVLDVSDVVSRGFSGVAAAILGLVLAVTVRAVWERANSTKALNAAVVIVLLVMVRILALGDALDLSTLGLATFGVILAISGLVSLEAVRAPSEIVATIQEDVGWYALVVYAAAVVVLVVPGLFPVEWVGDGRMVNVVSHATGFVGGTVVGVRA